MSKIDFYARMRMPFALAIALVVILAILLSMTPTSNVSASSSNVESISNESMPKLITMFIGDGMGYVQVQSTSYDFGSMQS